MCEISIIVPVYNTEKFLRRCLDSILCQTYTNYEIILVNDGSKDNSLDICKKYKTDHNNISIIDKENGGLSSARNAGLDIAKGKYISFVDSDDYIAPTMLEDLYNEIVTSNSDIVITKYKEVEDSSAKVEPTTEVRRFKGKDSVKLYLKERVESVCTNLYSKEIIGETRFIIGKTSEDIKFHLDLFKKPINISVMNGAYYFYYNNPNSITNGKMTSKKMSYIEFKEEQLFFYEGTKDEDLIKLAQILCARAYNGVLIRGAIYGVDDSLNEKEFFKENIKKLKKYLKLLLKSKEVPLSRKILSVVISINYRVLKIFRGIIK